MKKAIFTGVFLIGILTVVWSSIFAFAQNPGPSVTGGALLAPAQTPTFAAASAEYTGIPQIVISDATSGAPCTSYLVYNTTGASSGGNLTGTTTGTSVGISATTTIYAQVQSCPGHTNSPIATSSQYIVYGLAAVGGGTTDEIPGYILCSGITTGANASGYTLVAFSKYAQNNSIAGNLVSAIYTQGTGAQTKVIDGGSHPIGYTGTAQWLTMTYGGTLLWSTDYSICIQVSTIINIWQGSSGTFYYASPYSYVDFPSSVTFGGSSANAFSEYIVVTAN